MTNRKLLENMSKIMSNDYKSAVKSALSNPPKKIYGLNNKMKREEGLRIDHENLLMLNRLVKGKSTFNVDSWEK